MPPFRTLAACAVALGALSSVAAVARRKPSIVTVVKITGETWFTRMAEGVTA